MHAWMYVSIAFMYVCMFACLCTYTHAPLCVDMCRDARAVPLGLPDLRAPRRVGGPGLLAARRLPAGDADAPRGPGPRSSGRKLKFISGRVFWAIRRLLLGFVTKVVHAP